MLCMQIMVILNSNGDVHIGEKIHNITLTEHSNNFQLLPPEVVKLFMDIDKEENIQYVKQRLDEWFLPTCLRVTLFISLGLHLCIQKNDKTF